MARYDKYSGVTGGSRVPAAADAATADYDQVLGVGLSVAGRGVLRDPSNSGFIGVTIVDRTKRRAGDILDVMRSGEIVDVAGLTAGSPVYLTAVGVLTTVKVGNAARVGYTVEADRLVVNFTSGPEA